jgi:hypothetical protein
MHELGCCPGTGSLTPRSDEDAPPELEREHPAPEFERDIRITLDFNEKPPQLIELRGLSDVAPQTG